MPLLFLAALAAGQAPPAQTPAVKPPPPSPMEVLSPAEWQKLGQAVDQGLRWLATTQKADGSFEAPEAGQPGITALAVMAYLSRGHLPGQGPYGERLNRAIDFVLSCQKPDGLLCQIAPGPAYGYMQPAHAGIYDHAMAGLMLCEVFGMVDEARAGRIRSTVAKAMLLTLQRQKVPAKTKAEDLGGWRYYRNDPSSSSLSDLSITSWQLLFLRSAKNAGFDVPAPAIAEALDYVKRCYSPQLGTFLYSFDPGREKDITTAMAGAGALSLSMAGVHDSPMAQGAGQFILNHPFDKYNGETTKGVYDRYHYSAFYCCQATFQLGGNYWKGYFPPTSRTLIANQKSDGSWPTEYSSNGRFGSVYSSSLAILALTAPYQLLPIFQR
jgi:hypothetical protein